MAPAQQGIFSHCIRRQLFWRGGPRQKNNSPGTNQFTILSAQQLLANASGLALKAKPIPSI